MKRGERSSLQIHDENPRSGASGGMVKTGVIREAIERSMRAGIEAACKVPGVVKILAGNF